MILFVQGYRHTNHQFNVRQSLCQATIIILSAFHSILSAKRNYTLLTIFKTVQYKLLVPKCVWDLVRPGSFWKQFLSFIIGNSRKHGLLSLVVCRMFLKITKLPIFILYSNVKVSFGTPYTLPLPLLSQ